MRKISVKAASTSDRAISLGVRWRMAPFDQGDHAVQEGIAGIGGDLHDDAVGEDARAAGHAGAVAAGLADDRGRLAGNGRFVDRGHAFDDLAVAGNHLAGDDLDAGRRSRRSVESRSARRGSIGAARGGPGSSAASCRKASAWALPRASAMAEAKLANSKRRHQPEVQGQQIAAGRPRSG